MHFNMFALHQVTQPSRELTLVEHSLWTQKWTMTMLDLSLAFKTVLDFIVSCGRNLRRRIGIQLPFALSQNQEFSWSLWIPKLAPVNISGMLYGILETLRTKYMLFINIFNQNKSSKISIMINRPLKEIFFDFVIEYLRIQGSLTLQN